MRALKSLFKTGTESWKDSITAFFEAKTAIALSRDSCKESFREETLSFSSERTGSEFSKTIPFEEKYFSHIAPDGSDPAKRIERGGVSFTYVGENLAYAPSVETAHEGLMESPGHKRNILDPKYRRIGIGVIDSGIYGRMFTQNFAD